QRAMNKVMGGSLPARLWRDVMMLAHQGHVPAPLSSPARGSSRVLASPSGREAHERPNDRLLMPRERIGPEFVERAITAERGRPP
ncbi:MAG TPA: hypothetical protein VJ233_17100, partial [Hyphomicrobiaceae bacterium]|nr:hypothetical protein [Hyphomicrobiaceae bacterium]